MALGWSTRVAFRAAWACLRQHRWRSLLTLALCGLGTAGVLVAGVLAEANVAKVQASFRAMGGGLIVVSPNQLPPFPGRPRQLNHFISLEPEDCAAVAGQVSHRAIVPVAARNTTIRLGSQAARVRLIGTTPDFFAVRSFALANGRFFQAAEESEPAIVLGHAVSEELVPGGARPGQDVYLGTLPFRIAGVLRPQGVNFAGEDEDHQVFIPLDTYRRRIANRPWLSHLYLQVAPGTDSAQIARQVQELLRSRHGRWRDQVDDAIVRDLAELATRQNDLLSTATWAVAVTSGLLVLLGAVGIATLMVLVVRHRRTEIGLRRALGATPADVALQFFLEGSVLAASGVLVGLATGSAIAGGLTYLMAVPVQLPATILLLSAAVSLVSAAVACAFPAVLAARLEPGPLLRG